MKSFSISLITSAVALLSLGQPELIGYLKSSTNEVKLNSSEKYIKYSSKISNIAFYGFNQEKDISKVSSIAAEINVQIEGATKGTGVLIKKDGDRYTVITAWHVVKENRPNEEVGIITSDGIEHIWESKSLTRIGEVDMAIFTFTSTNTYQIAKIGDTKKISMGNVIFISGYPLANSSIPIRLIRFLRGRVITNTDLIIPDGYQLHYNNDTRSGMSGGSILNIKGELIGIHGRTEKNDEVAKLTGKVSSTGINMGIPINYYEQFIKPEKVNSYRFNPITSEDYLAQAYALMLTRKDPKKAILLAKKSLKLKENAEAYFVIASSKWDELNNVDDINKNLDKAIELNSKYALAYLGRGQLKLFLKQEYDDAILDLNKAIELDKKNNDIALIWRGYAKIKLGDNEGAILDLNNVKKLDSDRTDEIFFYLGIAKQNLERYEDAIQDFNKAIELNQKEGFTYALRGETKYYLGDKKGALNDFNKAIELNPENTSIYKKMKAFSLNIGDNKKARELTIKLLILRIKSYSKEIIWGLISLIIPSFWYFIFKNKNQSS